MNTTFQKLREWLFLLFTALFLNTAVAQPLTAQTYYDLGTETYPFSLITNGNGTLYFADEYTYPNQIKKLSSNGELTTYNSTPFYLPNYSWDYPSAASMSVDQNGNLYYVDQYNWPPVLNKITPDGVVSNYLSGNYYPKALVHDSQGNMYFVDQMNWPYSIYKIDSNGFVSLFFSDSTYYINSISIDSEDNLVFVDANSNTSIYKISPQGVLSNYISNTGFYIKSLTTDGLGNTYALNQNSNPYTVYKMDAIGTINLYAEIAPNVNDVNSMVSDFNGNLYFLGYTPGGVRKVFTFTNPDFPCNPPSDPLVTDVNVCYNQSAELRASGIGEIKWYDAINGNLLGTGSSYTTDALINATTFYVTTEFCNQVSSFVPVAVTVKAPPVALISGNTTNNDLVTLTVSGAAAIFWSGGTAPTSATNYFTRSGTYTVTITNEFGCTDTEVVSLIVNKLGVTPSGALTSNFTEGISKNGKVNEVTYLNRYGKVSSALGVDEELNYQVFTAPFNHPNNETEFAAYTDPLNLVSSGVKSPNLILDWNNATVLTNEGIVIPNGGEGFSFVASGFFIPSETGTYTFTCEGDDAVDLFINGVNVANHYGGHGIDNLGSHTGTIVLTQGMKYTFRARMQENGGGEGLRVFWRKPSDASGWYLYPEELSSE